MDDLREGEGMGVQGRLCDLHMLGGTTKNSKSSVAVELLVFDASSNRLKHHTYIWYECLPQPVK